MAKKRERAVGVGTFQPTQRVDEDELKGKETGETFLLRDPVSTRASAFSPSAGTPSVPTDRIECGMVSVRPNEKHIELAFYGRELHGACTRAFDLPTLAACRSAIGQSTGDGTTQRVYPHSASVPLLTSGTADHFVHFLPADKRDGVRDHRDSGKRDALDDLVPEIRDAATLLFAPPDHPTEVVARVRQRGGRVGVWQASYHIQYDARQRQAWRLRVKIDGVLKTLCANLDAEWHSVRNRLPNPPSHAELSFETRLEEIQTMIANGELVLSITRADYANAGVDPCASFASSGTRYQLGAVTQVNEPKLLQDCTNVGRAGVYGAPQTVDNWTALKDKIKADPGLPEVWVVPMLRPDEKATRDVRMFTDADKAGALGFLDDTEPFGDVGAPGLPAGAAGDGAHSARAQRRCRFGAVRDEGDVLHDIAKVGRSLRLFRLNELRRGCSKTRVCACRRSSSKTHPDPEARRTHENARRVAVVGKTSASKALRQALATRCAGLLRRRTRF